MNEHTKKMIAPVVITILLIAYYVAYFGFLVAIVPGGYKYLIGVLPVLLAGAMLYVCIQRIHEIKKGEEDDLSKY